MLEDVARRPPRSASHRGAPGNACVTFSGARASPPSASTDGAAEDAVRALLLGHAHARVDPIGARAARGGAAAPGPRKPAPIHARSPCGAARSAARRGAAPDRSRRSPVAGGAPRPRDRGSAARPRRRWRLHHHHLHHRRRIGGPQAAQPASIRRPFSSQRRPSRAQHGSPRHPRRPRRRPGHPCHRSHPRRRARSRRRSRPRLSATFVSLSGSAVCPWT